MRTSYEIRLVLLFAVTVSLASLPGPLSSHFNLPSIPAVKAVQETTAGSWYPAGAQMKTLSLSTFTDQVSEFNSLQSGQIDAMMDPLTASQQSSTCAASTTIVCSKPVPDHGYFDIEFNLAGVLWGIAQNYGNSPGGVELRQGVAHLVNKQNFVATDPACNGILCTANDQATPVCTTSAGCTNGGVYSANPCSWDTKYIQTGSACVVGAAGGTSYNCNFSAACPSGTITGTTTFAWQAAIGSPDFCAAAQHLVQAFSDAGISGVTTNANCELVAPTGGWPTAVTAIASSCSGQPATADICFVVDSSRPRKDLGEGVAQEICALFSPAFAPGGWTTLAGQPLTCNPFLQEIEVPVTVSGFCVSTTSTTGTPSNCWGMYTGDVQNSFSFDSSLYHVYNGLFATETTVTCMNVDCSANVPGSTCVSSTLSSGATDYVYVCSPAYDALSSLMEFSSCTASPGPATDPVPGTTTPTFANCSGGAVSGTCTSTSSCTALSAGYQAENYFGSHAFTIPIWSGINIQARQSYLPLGDAPGYFAGGLWNSRYNFFEWLNGYSTSTVSPLDLKEGINNGATSVNPFTANNFFDLSILLSVYDGLFMPNPECLASTTPACASLFQLMDWMTIQHALVCGPSFPCSATTLGYTPPPGTFADLRLVLNRNMHWQDCTTGCQPVTAWDVKYTLINLEAAAPYLAGLGDLANINGIQVLNLYTLDLNLKAFSFLDTELALNLITIIPGHVWSACGTATWNSNLAAAAPTIGDNLSHDPQMLYVETGSDTHWDSGESVIMDYDSNGMYSGGDTVLYGPIPAPGTTLSTDPLVSFDNPSFPAFTRQSWTGQTVIYDNSAIGTYAAGDTIILQKSGSGGSNISGTSIVAAPEDACIGTSTGTCSVAFGTPSARFRGCIGSMIPPGGSSPVSFADPIFDPVTNGFLIGSGPWVCESIGGPGHPAAGTIGAGCTSDNTQAPPSGLGAFTLTRMGCPITSGACGAPTVGSDYFRSSGNLALYIWTGDIGSGSADFSKILTVNSCHSSSPSANCPHWAQGIGNAGGTGSNPVGLSQRLKVNSLRGISWIAFSTDTNPSTQLVLACGPGYTLPGTTLTTCTAASAGWQDPILPGIGTYPSTLYEVGSALSGVSTSTLSPAAPLGGPNGAYTNCAGPIGTGSAYPNGGYDC